MIQTIRNYTWLAGLYAIRLARRLGLWKTPKPSRRMRRYLRIKGDPRLGECTITVEEGVRAW